MPNIFPQACLRHMKLKLNIINIKHGLFVNGSRRVEMDLHYFVRLLKFIALLNKIRFLEQSQQQFSSSENPKL